ncbi:MAG: DNA repair protein RecO [Cytophagales bacterium]|nr:MAG: DNA repair protein RecO [Cytophagales bacterium]
MLVKTKAIVLNYIKYKESSIIVRAYTEALGIQSYLVNGVRSSKAKSNKIAFYQPLSLLDMVVYYKKNSTQGLFRVSEVRYSAIFQSFHSDIRKMMIALFLAELLSKTLQEEETNPTLFHFLHSSISFLAEQKENTENFHLSFLYQLAGYLGFQPSQSNDFFEPLQIPMTPSQQTVFEQLTQSNYHTPLSLTASERSQWIDWWLLFYSLHIDNFGEMRSLAVLRAL